MNVRERANRRIITRQLGSSKPDSASDSRFEREFIAATAQLPADEDGIYSVVADPILRKALKPTDE